jgi:hypothetical protein
MLVVAGVFLTYTFFGNQPWMPEVIQWRGASFGKAMWHYWMQTEGVFGVALAVSATMIFLFVLFGSLLERAGAGYYFIKLAFALLGHICVAVRPKRRSYRLGGVGPLLRLVYRQCGDHWHLHHSVDEEDRVQTGKSRCR